MNWSKYPFFRLLPPFALGILIRDALGSKVMDSQTEMLVLLGMLLIAWMLSRLLKPYRLRWIFGVWMLLTFVFLGFFRHDMLTERILQERDVMTCTKGVALAKVVEPPVEKERSVKVMLEIMAFRSRGQRFPASGKVMAYLEKTERALALDYGAVLCFGSGIEAPRPPLNPGEFDYRRYLLRKGVSGTVYLKEDGWLSLGVNEGNRLLGIAYHIRDHLLSLLKQCGVTEEAFGVGAALLLGYDESLPAQVRQHYVAAGAMHVLCVSGMHVGVVYLLASYLLSFMGKGKRMLKVKRILLLLLVWCYATLAGLSPSVIRSSLMITMVSLGSLLQRKGNLLNSIAASAFLMLVINTNDLFAIGFQLSYAAVMGIALLQRPIYHLLFVNNKLLDKIWELTSVSLAAQVATMPFTIYHFHQFTPYFWLSNLFMTPLSFVAILSGMGLLAVSWIPWLGMAWGKVVWWCLHLMNGAAAWVERLPLSLIQGLYINKVEFALCLLLLVLFFDFLKNKRKRILMEMLVVSFFFAFSLAFRSHSVACQETMTLYSLRRHTCVDLAVGTDHLLICDEGLLDDAGTIDYSLKGNWARCQLSMNPPCYTVLEDFDSPLAQKRRNLVSFNGKLLAFWDPKVAATSPVQRLPVDYLLVRGGQRPTLGWVLRQYHPSLLLIDGSVSKREAEEWERQASAWAIPYYNVQNGAWIELIFNKL